LLDPAARIALEVVAEAAGLSLDELLAGARDHIETGRYLTEGGRWEGFYIPDDFWKHYEEFTGEVVPEEDQNNFFSCSC
jgi:hypothetical protein